MLKGTNGTPDFFVAFFGAAHYFISMRFIILVVAVLFWVLNMEGFGTSEGEKDCAGWLGTTPKRRLVLPVEGTQYDPAIVLSANGKRFAQLGNIEVTPDNIARHRIIFYDTRRGRRSQRVIETPVGVRVALLGRLIWPRRNSRQPIWLKGVKVTRKFESESGTTAVDFSANALGSSAPKRTYKREVSLQVFWKFKNLMALSHDGRWFAEVIGEGIAVGNSHLSGFQSPRHSHNLDQLGLPAVVAIAPHWVPYQWILVSEKNDLFIVDVKQAKVVHQNSLSTEIEGPITSVASAPDKSGIVVGTEKGGVYLLDSFKGPAEKLGDHDSAVVQLVFPSGGRHFYSVRSRCFFMGVSENGQVIRWDYLGRQLLPGYRDAASIGGLFEN